MAHLLWLGSAGLALVTRNLLGWLWGLVPQVIVILTTMPQVLYLHNGRGGSICISQILLCPADSVSASAGHVIPRLRQMLMPQGLLAYMESGRAVILR